MPLALPFIIPLAVTLLTLSTPTQPPSQPLAPKQPLATSSPERTLQQVRTNKQALRHFTRVLRCENNWQRRVLAVRALARLDKRAIPALTESLRDRHPEVRRAACEGIGPFLQDAAPAIPTLARLVQDTHREVRASAALALGWTRVRSRRSTAALLRALHDGYSYVRLNAATSLGEIRDPRTARQVVPALVETLGDLSPFVQVAARRALGWILRDEPQAMSTVLDALHATDWRVRRGACEAFDIAGPSAHAAIAQLRCASRDSFWRVREAATLALASILSQTHKSLP